MAFKRKERELQIEIIESIARTGKDRQIFPLKKLQRVPKQSNYVDIYLFQFYCKDCYLLQSQYFWLLYPNKVQTMVLQSHPDYWKVIPSNSSSFLFFNKFVDYPNGSNRGGGQREGSGRLVHFSRPEREFL
ncbi:hypothetical protein H6P81_018528 [Aristolochia fimbriata]|uniref:Uncharacterized protein n=1 Tax=Aristolochia fimbriata TaxID=158543 RepID=A0AAV7E3B0_ARIFI|nr:hypothetical protein H6P81_018528 [Aristolochia fimbriata]